MADWKKVAVSGSGISQFNNDSGYVTSVTATNAFATASFNGTNILADDAQGALNFASSSGQGLDITANAGTDTLTFGLSDIPNTSLANSTISGVALGGNLSSLTDGNGIVDFTYNGSSTATVTIDLDGSTLAVGAAGVKVADAGITATQLNTSVAGTGLSGGGGTALSLDEATATVRGGIELFSNTDNPTAANTISSTASRTYGLQLNSAGQGVINVPWTDTQNSYTATLVAGTGLAGTTYTPSAGSTFSVDLTELTVGNGLDTPDATTLNLDLTEVIATDGANRVLTSDGDGTLTAETNFTFNGSTLGVTGDVTVTGDITATDAVVTGDLTVFGTASFQNTENLVIADRFILLASGSNTSGDGGLIVQQATQDVGELFGFDSGTSRWAVTSSFTADDSAFIPDAYMAAALVGTGTDPNAVASRYDAKGNIFVGTDEEIWIYA
tara:strand:+ start:7681 stop:9009 length:1329 start_codon:yes stop_codon:yes gene_type:complete